MSRFESYDFDGGYDQYDDLRSNGWHHAKDMALKGKRGLRVLQEMEQALLSLNEPQLIANYITKDGKVCAVGAYAKYKGLDISKFDNLSDFEIQGDETTDLGVSAGMQRTIAWTLANLNDEACEPHYTPEQRYDLILSWVRKKIEQNPHNAQKASVAI